MSAPTDRVAAYRGVMDRTAMLLDGLADDMLDGMVPATPAWTVLDLVGHMVGVSADSAAGNLQGAGSDPWTEEQVSQRKGRTVAELLAEWESQWPAVQELLPTIKPFRSGQMVFDAVTHEHDLRGAIDQSGARDSDGFEIGWEWAADIVGQMRDGVGAGALRLRTEEGDRVAGAGEPTGAVTASRFELFRAMTGRRSEAQIRAWVWEGEPALDHLCFLGRRDTDLAE